MSELNLEPEEIVGKRTRVYRESFPDNTEGLNRDDWLELILEYPAVITRPIVRWDGKAEIARPPEEVLEKVRVEMDQ